MATTGRRILLGIGLLLLGGACNPLMLPFLFSAKEPKTPPEYFSLASSDKKKEVRVVILTYMGIDARTEFLRADGEIARLFAKELQELCKYNEEKVTVVNPMKVEEYKNSNPDWHAQNLDLESVGKHFKADYVIYLEIGQLSMYQKGSSNTFYRGHAQMTVSLVNVNNPDDPSTPSREFTCIYPREERGGNMVADADTPPHVFKSKFFNAMARKLAWLFTAHPTNQTYREE